MEKLTQTGAGRLYNKMAFDQREMVDDGYGNQVAGDWTEQFQRRAEFIHMRGSEAIMASRLASHAPMLVRIRVDTQTKRIDTDWQARDVRQDMAFNIRDITYDNSRAVIDLLLESGVATG